MKINTLIAAAAVTVGIATQIVAVVWRGQVCWSYTRSAWQLLRTRAAALARQIVTDAHIYGDAGVILYDRLHACSGEHIRHRSDPFLALADPV